MMHSEMPLKMVFVAFAGCLFLTMPASGDMISTFDSDLEGWTRSGDATSVFEWLGDAGPSGPGDGVLYWQDAAVSQGDYIHAPAAFRGDLSDMLTLAFDMRRGNDTQVNDLEVYFESTSGNYTVNLGTDYGSAWRTYTIDLVNDVFPHVGETTISDLRIKLDLVVGQDEAFVDNVSLVGNAGSDGPVPEPATLGLLCAGSVALLRRRRR